MDYKEFERLGLNVGDLIVVTYTRYGRITHDNKWGNWYNLAVGLFNSAYAEGGSRGSRYPVLSLCSIIQRGSEVIIPMHSGVGDTISPQLPCYWEDIISVQRLKAKEELEHMLELSMQT
jgi:hypothetical protein